MFVYSTVVDRNAHFPFIIPRKSGFYGMYGDQKDFWEDDRGVPRPRRSSGSGPWSGLKFSVRAQNIPSYLDAKPGVLVNE